ncbi:hypothetical protein H6P81_011481 [Aristolochia fimbriata]|uniref:poly(A)-specific ribonuclease n=1 Tax=Aristolochia fimbriata TaxID=158543 RepID=A0AAV7EV39_ARIFI|nr:hypothetical protein H6P81_011481 [Aristolochia fimbriata]
MVPTAIHGPCCDPWSLLRSVVPAAIRGPCCNLWSLLRSVVPAAIRGPCCDPCSLLRSVKNSYGNPCCLVEVQVLGWAYLATLYRTNGWLSKPLDFEDVTTCWWLNLFSTKLSNLTCPGFSSSYFKRLPCEATEKCSSERGCSLERGGSSESKLGLEEKIQIIGKKAIRETNIKKRMMHYELKVQITLKTPVVGFKIVPRVTCVGSDRVLDENLRFNWYRLEKKEVFFCCVHPTKTASIQCLCCVALNIPVQLSYYCSLTCFSNSWGVHGQRHALAHSTINKPLDLNEGIDDIRTCSSFWTAFRNQGQFHPKSPSGTNIDGYSLVLVGTSMSYIPEIEDINCVLRLDCVVVDSNGRALGPSNITYTNQVIAAPKPHIRRLIEVGQLRGSENDCVGEYKVHRTFSVLSYNLLADIYANQVAHPQCPAWALSWEYRRQKLLREIICYKPDILCLQEVQSDHFENYLAPELIKHGYSAVYKKKTSEVYTGSQFVSDGCAICFRCDRFIKIKSYEIEFNSALIRLTQKLGIQLKETHMRRLMKDNVAVVVILEFKKNYPVLDVIQFESRNLICVANTHITANEEIPDVKLLQVYTLLDILERDIGDQRIPLLLCGDLNSVPRSAAYDLIVTGKVDSSHEELKVDPSNVIQQINLAHNLKLVNAYSAQILVEHGGPGVDELKKCINWETMEPYFTSYREKFSGTLDYIFFSATILEVIGLLELLCPASLKSYIPSIEWSSDHLAIMARFHYPQSTKKRL